MPRLALAALLLVACGSSPPERVSHSAPPEPEREVEPAPDPVAQLSVMTYNVNYGTAGDASIVAAIRDADADIVFLQETNARWERAIRKALADAYPHMAFVHCCRAGGLAVLSKQAFAAREHVQPKAGMFPAWRLVLDTPLGPIQVLNLHLHPVWRQGRGWIEAYMATRARHAEEMRELLPLLDAETPTLLVGDFNEDAATGTVAPIVRELGYETVLVSRGIRAPTWRWETRAGEVAWQLDHIYVGSGLSAVDAWVIDAGASDHLPIVATIERAAL